MPNPLTLSTVPRFSSLAGLVNNGEIMRYDFHSQQSEVGVTITSVSHGNPCVIGVASTTNVYPGQWVRITGTLAGLNGNQKVLHNFGSSLVLDYDSTALGTYVSGGLVNCDLVHDTFGYGPVRRCTGTVMGIWGAPELGAKGNATGWYCDVETGSSIDIFNLQTNTAPLLLSARVRFAGNPTSVEEIMLAAGVSGQSATGSAAGYVRLSLTTSGLLGFQYRRASAADNGATTMTSNTGSGAITANTEHTVSVWIDPVAGQYYLVKDALTNDVKTDYLPMDGNAHMAPLGWAMGATIDASLVVSSTRRWGKGSTSVPNYLQYLYVVRNPRLVLSDFFAFCRDFHSCPSDLPRVLLK